MCLRGCSFQVHMFFCVIRISQTLVSEHHFSRVFGCLQAKRARFYQAENEMWLNNTLTVSLVVAASCRGATGLSRCVWLISGQSPGGCLPWVHFCKQVSPSQARCLWLQGLDFVIILFTHTALTAVIVLTCLGYFYQYAPCSLTYFVQRGEKLQRFFKMRQLQLFIFISHSLQHEEGTKNAHTKIFKQ